MKRKVEEVVVVTWRETMLVNVAIEGVVVEVVVVVVAAEKVSSQTSSEGSS